MKYDSLKLPQVDARFLPLKCAGLLREAVNEYLDSTTKQDVIDLF